MIQPMTLTMAAQTFGGTLMYPDCEFSAVSTDSRHIREGDVFVALRGERFDAHNFLPDVATRASGMVVEYADRDINLPQWVVPDTTVALGQLALLNRRRFHGPVVAITGSSGKTTVKEMVAAILGECGSVLATKGNLNNQIGVPLTLLSLTAKHRFAVIEMGASGPSEISYLCSLAKPDVVLVNNVLPAHVSGFGSLERIASAKGEIYSGVCSEGTAVINLDESWAPQWRAATLARVVSYSLVNESADFRAKTMVSDPQGCYSFVLVTPVGEAAVQLAVSGRHNVANALAAAACAHAAGADLGAVAAGLNKVRAVPGRLHRQVLASGGTLIDDSYNANPGSVKAAVDTLMTIRGKQILVLGDMGELGDNEAALHGEVGRYAADRGVCHLLAVGPLSINTVREFGEGAEHLDSKEQLLERLKSLLDKDAVVLVKGSRFMAMDTVVKMITELGEH
ncbi:UDP-N-acetylmuramoyl-tripeptide--D-alanyl-D-alanine ligase [Porticoccus hydrocarbonoclasticus]|uniref:UDP-N-acetylmuramoyl-tripeptide--D-alanyl-D- alanine ligase n=1 Tax=Porticoccus hydrocarbonoclasticus TaxID=1073414 RepID=UPI000560F19B|nr:UDP-N-acetylmuramoyl-tripeptide--D-alanyl-D-alanine ligase [Porticoccus hydrocarbonoclasticus]